MSDRNWGVHKVHLGNNSHVVGDFAYASVSDDGSVRITFDKLISPWYTGPVSICLENYDIKKIVDDINTRRGST